MAGSSTDSPPRFYYDLASPEAYLVAERSHVVLGVVPEWVPVRLGEVGPFRCAEEIAAYQEDIARRAAAYGLLPLRWPATFPGDSGWAMVVATYARQIGRVVAYSQAAFRQTFAAGRDIGDPDTVLLAGAAAEMHPAAVEKGSGRASITRRLDEATAGAVAAGVRDVPAIVIGEQVFHGDRELEAAAAALRG